MKRFLLYLLRWQSAGIVTIPSFYVFQHYRIPEFANLILIALVGGIVFYHADKWIFTR